MDPRQYVDLKDNSRDLQPTYYFMINCLLYSRMETGLVSNQDCYDEDVNVYLAHLLHAFINPEYVDQSKKFLSKYDADVFRRLSTSTDARLKYQIYKTNADFLLVSIGIFDHPIITGASRSRLQPSEEAYIGRGKTYYHFAYTYSQQMHRKNAGVSEVLEKLSNGFEKYLRILSHMRGEYLDLMKRFSQGEVYHLERSIDEHSQQELLKVKQDELLELYTAWQNAPSTDAKALVSYQGALQFAARKLADAGLDLLIEPINRRNMPGYFLDDFALAEKIVADSGMPNVKLQFDIYHRQIMHGDVTMALRRLMPIVGHVQIASVPSRNEPDGEELNYPFLFEELDRLGYEGFVGCEYNPRGRTTDGLAWFKPFARS